MNNKSIQTNSNGVGKVFDNSKLSEFLGLNVLPVDISHQILRQVGVFEFRKVIKTCKAWWQERAEVGEKVLESYKVDIFRRKYKYGINSPHLKEILSIYKLIIRQLNEQNALDSVVMRLIAK